MVIYLPITFIEVSKIDLSIFLTFQANITVVTEWIPNEISSTKVRRALYRNESVKFLINDSVESYIKEHGLYGTINK